MRAVQVIFETFRAGTAYCLANVFCPPKKSHDGKKIRCAKKKTKFRTFIPKDLVPRYCNDAHRCVFETAWLSYKQSLEEQNSGAKRVCFVNHSPPFYVFIYSFYSGHHSGKREIRNSNCMRSNVI